MRTHYQNLKVKPYASSDDIEFAYQNLISLHDPKKFGKEERKRQIEIMGHIRAAYHVLSNHRLRAKYDVWLEKQGAKINEDEKAYDFTKTPPTDFDFEKVAWSGSSNPKALTAIMGCIALLIAGNLIGRAIYDHYNKTDISDIVEEVRESVKPLSAQELEFEHMFNQMMKEPMVIDEYTTVTEMYAKGYNVIVKAEVSVPELPKTSILRKQIKERLIGLCEVPETKDYPLTFTYEYVTSTNKHKSLKITLAELCE